MKAPAQIIGLQVAKTDKGRRVATGEISFAREVLLDGDDGQPGFLRMAAKMIHSGDFYGNPRSQLCNENIARHTGYAVGESEYEPDNPCRS